MSATVEAWIVPGGLIAIRIVDEEVAATESPGDEVEAFTMTAEAAFRVAGSLIELGDDLVAARPVTPEGLD
jgi:hypothetical protein